MKRLVLLLAGMGSLFAGTPPPTLEQIAADKSLWPAEVMVVVDHKVPLVIDGKTRKTLPAGPGKIYQVRAVTPKGVEVHALGAVVTFAAEDTDLLARAGQRVAQAVESAPAPPASSPLPSATPVPASSAPPEAKAAPPTWAPRASPPSAARSPSGSSGLASRLSGQLVRYAEGKLQPFDAAELAGKKFFAVYFSASWSGPCRQFTPAFVEWYNSRPDKDRFEVIFVSSDQDEKSMAGYMAADQMPWPAVSFARARNNPLLKYAGSGIPCVVILDRNGSVLAGSYEDGEYVGPIRPLKFLDSLLNAQ